MFHMSIKYHLNPSSKLIFLINVYIYRNIDRYVYNNKHSNELSYYQFDCLWWYLYLNQSYGHNFCFCTIDVKILGKELFQRKNIFLKHFLHTYISSISNSSLLSLKSWKIPFFTIDLYIIVVYLNNVHYQTYYQQLYQLYQ